MEFVTSVALPLVFGFVGGLFAVVMGVYGWFGRVLAARWLASVRKAVDADLKKLQGQIDRTVIVHRAHFETEFAALQDIWKKVARLRAVFPAMEHPGPDPAVQSAAREAVQEATAELVRAIDQQSPFYAKDIYANLDELRLLAKLALSDYVEEHAGRRTIGRNYGHEVRERAESISDEIRIRIEALTVVS